MVRDAMRRFEKELESNDTKVSRSSIKERVVLEVESHMRLSGTVTLVLSDYLFRVLTTETPVRTVKVKVNERERLV